MLRVPHYVQCSTAIELVYTVTQQHMHHVVIHHAVMHHLIIHHAVMHHAVIHHVVMHHAVICYSLPTVHAHLLLWHAPGPEACHDHGYIHICVCVVILRHLNILARSAGH